jgi:hypothetical protein
LGTLAIGRPTEGGSNADLAAAIRAKVAAGLLPRDRPQKIWVGPGSGKACDGCELPITSGQREYEFDVPGGRTIRLHADCVALWHVERTGRDAPRERRGDADTTATHIAAILRDGFPSGYCIACLAARMELPVPEVRDAAQILVARPGFRVVERVCYTCGRIRDDVVLLEGAGAQ